MTGSSGTGMTGKGHWTNADELTAGLRALLDERHPFAIFSLELRLVGDAIVITGEVASEDCRADATRLLLGFDDVWKVRNELRVASFLEGASDSADEDEYFGGGSSFPRHISGTDWANDGASQAYWGDRQSGQSPAGQDFAGVGPESRSRPSGFDPLKLPMAGHPALDIKVTRFPAMRAEGRIAPREILHIEVALGTEGVDGVESIDLGSFKPEWTRIEITVQLASSAFSTAVADNPTIVVTRDGGEPAKFRCTLSDEITAGSEIPVTAIFFHGTRHCGQASYDLSKLTNAPPSPAEVANPPTDQAIDRTGGRATVNIMPEAVGPALSVLIANPGEGRQNWSWMGLLNRRRIYGNDTIDLGTTAKDFSDGLLKACPTFQKSEFRRRMRGIGTQIWQSAPQRFRQDYASLVADSGTGFPIQIISDDAHVPWEMMYPDIEGAKLDHLFLEHPVARWPLSRADPMQQDLPAGAICSFVPEYDEGGTLPSALAEGQWLFDTYKASKMSPVRDKFLETLSGSEDQPIRMLHFAGHGRADSGSRDAGIRLQDEWVMIDDINQPDVRLGKTHGTFVVINACESASSANLLGTNAGWGSVIAERGFGGLIAPLWAVQDAAAFAMMKSAVTSLFQRGTVGEALKDARRSVADESVAAFAYIAHGDVMARYR